MQYIALLLSNQIVGRARETGIDRLPSACAKRSRMIHRMPMANNPLRKYQPKFAEIITIIYIDRILLERGRA